MNYNEHFQSKLTLLNQYALCLQKQNQSKNKQIQTLHHHLQLINQENQTLRLQLREAILKTHQKKCDFKDASLQTSQSFKDTQQLKEIVQVSTQTQAQEQDQYDYQDEIKKLREIIVYKQQKLKKHQAECEQMYEAIEKLEKELIQHDSNNKKYNQKITILEDLLRQEQQKRIAAEKYLENIADSVGNTDEANNALAEQYYEMKISLEQLIIENNMLIQKSRELQKQKNEYYHQLKAQIRMQSVNQPEAKSSLKKEAKIKDQRWREIQLNLQRLQLQNEAMQSNLMVRR